MAGNMRLTRARYQLPIRRGMPVSAKNARDNYGVILSANEFGWLAVRLKNGKRVAYHPHDLIYHICTCGAGEGNHYSMHDKGCFVHWWRRFRSNAKRT